MTNFLSNLLTSEVLNSGYFSSENANTKSRNFESGPMDFIGASVRTDIVTSKLINF